MKNKFKVLLAVLALSSVMGVAAACDVNNPSEPLEYTVKFVNDDDTVISEAEYEGGATVTVPANPTKAESNGYTYTFAGWDKEVTAVTGDVIYKATYKATPVTYTITFIADGVEVGTVDYTVEDTEITEPSVPAKAGYSGKWETYTLDGGNKTVNAFYNAGVYRVTFKADGITVATEDYTVEDKEITEPSVPAKEHYTGAWESYTLENSDVTVNAVYTPIEYTVTFVAGGITVATEDYTVEDTEITEPSVPAKDHYTGAWENYTLENSDVTVNAVYTPITYVITFMNGEEKVKEIEFNVENTEQEAPAVPQKAGYTGKWGEYSFTTLKDQTVSVSYNPNTYTITYNANGGSVEKAEQAVVYDDNYTLATATASKFYQEFLGWQDEEGNVWEMKGDWTIASDVTLTAQYSNVITFDSMTEVPSYLQGGGRATLSIVEGNGGKVLQATSENNDQGNVRIMMTIADIAAFFEDSAVQYIAFDLKLPEGVIASGSSILYQNADQSGWTSYETSQFDTVPTDAYKAYYLPRSAYEAWVAGGKTEARILNVQAGVTQGKSYWVDNIRPVTADEYTSDLYSFETGSLRTTMNDGPGFCSPSNNQFHLKFTNADPMGARFTNEIVSDGMRALMFTKYSGVTQIMFNQNTETSMETEMRGAGYVAFDLYVPEGSDAAIVRYGQTWYGKLKTGWNTIYEKVDATNNELISFTDTTASTYVIDNFRLLTEEEYNAAMCGFEMGGVLRDNNSNDDTSHSGWMNYYAGADKATNKCSIGITEGNGAGDVATLSNVRFATEQVHSGEYSLAFDKESGYISLHMAADSTMYALMRNGFTFWIYSTTEMNGTSDTQFINGVNGKLNGGEGVTIKANTWTQITITAEDIHSTAGRFLILQGVTEGTIYLDDFQPLPAVEE